MTTNHAIVFDAIKNYPHETFYADDMIKIIAAAVSASSVRKILDDFSWTGMLWQSGDFYEKRRVFVY